MAPPLLVLHVDVNKTIVIADPVAGKNVSDMLNSILAENAWGRVLTEGEEKKWVLAEECLTPTLSPPAKGLVNYHDYIEELYPFPCYAPQQTTSERQAVLREVKRRRHQRVNKFTHPGEPGEKFGHFYSQLENALRVECLDAVSPCTERPFHYVLPSFFKLLSTLHDRKRDFVIVFRSFGTDIPRVTEAVTQYCQGNFQHLNPCKLPSLAQVSLG